MEQTLTPFLNIAVGCFKIPRIPGIGYFTGRVGEIEQAEQLSVWIAAADPPHVAQIPVVHPNQIVICFVVAPCHLHGVFFCAGNAEPAQNLLCSPMNRIPDFFRACCGGCGENSVTVSLAPSDVPHQIFRHRRSTDIAVTYKQYFDHLIQFPS